MQLAQLYVPCSLHFVEFVFLVLAQLQSQIISIETSVSPNPGMVITKLWTGGESQLNGKEENGDNYKPNVNINIHYEGDITRNQVPFDFQLH